MVTSRAIRFLRQYFLPTIALSKRAVRVSSSGTWNSIRATDWGSVSVACSDFCDSSSGIKGRRVKRLLRRFRRLSFLLAFEIVSCYWMKLSWLCIRLAILPFQPYTHPYWVPVFYFLVTFLATRRRLQLTCSPFLYPPEYWSHLWSFEILKMRYKYPYHKACWANEGVVFVDSQVGWFASVQRVLSSIWYKCCRCLLNASLADPFFLPFMSPIQTLFVKHTVSPALSKVKV